MPYPTATRDDLAFFNAHGWIQIDDAVDPDDLDIVIRHCDYILDHKDELAYDWAWAEGTPREKREFRIVQSSPTSIFPALAEERFRLWATTFAGSLMQQPMEFWYDQFLAKPPETGATTNWHQDEGYWGRNLDDRGITCWMPFHDVDEGNGCMHFVDGGHLHGVLPHTQVPGAASDLLVCEPDHSRVVACPMTFGSATFHHSKTPHMTTPNRSSSWRRALTQHFKAVGVEGEGAHYPWKVYVNQFTGERTVPADRA